jgi:hypothetical protein
VKLRWNSRRLLINTRPPILEYFAIFLNETIYKIKPQILIPTCQRIRVFFLPITHITQTHQLSVHHLRRTLSSSCNKSSNSMKCGYATVFISIIICVGLAVFNLTVQELTFLENLLQIAIRKYLRLVRTKPVDRPLFTGFSKFRKLLQLN